MTGTLSQVPLKLLLVAILGLAAGAFLTVLLGWHGFRRRWMFRVSHARAGCTWRWARSGLRSPRPARWRPRRSCCSAITGASTRRPRWATFAAKRSDPTACAWSCERRPRRRRNAMRSRATRAPSGFGRSSCAPASACSACASCRASKASDPRAFPPLSRSIGSSISSRAGPRRFRSPFRWTPQVHSVLVSSLSGPMLTNGGICQPRSKKRSDAREKVRGAGLKGAWRKAP